MTYKLWAPTCAVPDCTNLVAYHKKTGNIFKWKMFCEPHRDPAQLKHSADRWKMSEGCSNTDAHHGFKCTSFITNASQLDINHIDGNRTNQTKENLEVLCKICHQRVTIENGHHTTRYVNQVYLNPKLFEFV